MNKIIKDIQERFANFETVGGAFWIVAGLVIVFFQQHIITLAGVGAFFYGVYTLLVNRIEQERRKEKLLKG
ncbi:MAG: hypothetical protein MI745_14020 [Pseudomonadales bacterium]|nr:hypothetical protein [Pseudomonadales bacterium]